MIHPVLQFTVILLILLIHVVLVKSPPLFCVLCLVSPCLISLCKTQCGILGLRHALGSSPNLSPSFCPGSWNPLELNVMLCVIPLVVEDLPTMLP